MALVPAFEIGAWNSWIFMLWPWLDTLVFRLVGKEVFQRASGLDFDMKTSRAYRTISYISMITEFLAVAYSIFLPFKLGTIWFYAGLAIFLLGLVVLIIASVNFIVTPTNTPITRGMYRYSRHPLYLASLLIYLSVVIASASWIFLVIFIVQFISISIGAIREERSCLEMYGESYREYMNNTPRWIGIPK